MDEELLLSYNPDSHSWTLGREYEFTFMNDVVTIAKGCNFDASIPRTLWGLVSPNELGITPVLIHDYLYEHKGCVLGRNGVVWYDRQDADARFLKQMKTIKIKYLLRNLAYFAVRMGGWIYWNR